MDFGTVSIAAKVIFLCALSKALTDKNEVCGCARECLVSVILS